MIAKTRSHVLLPVLLLLLLSSAILTASSFGKPKPTRKVEECLSSCQESFIYHQDRQLLENCEQICFDKYSGLNGKEREKEEDQQNPYYFGEESFEYRTKTEQGFFKVLERFTERSELLKGIEKYRLAILEAGTNTFLLPRHWDAVELFYVMEGRGILNVLKGSDRKSHDIEKGDIMLISSGSQVYLFNNDDNNKLRIAMLLQPVSTPGLFKEFFGAGGRNPESLYRSFSTEVLQAAFNTTMDRVNKLTGQQWKGEIVKATKEQIKVLSEFPSGGWFFGPSKSCRGSGTSLLSIRHRVRYSNDHGELYKIYACEYRDLHDLGLDISFANISRGSMMAPHYNSEATLVGLVVEGRGYFEMVCPHTAGPLHKKEQEQDGAHYQAVRSQLSRDSVFVIPAGHPVVAVASRDENLQVLFFGMNAKDNRIYFLAGRNNVLDGMENVAKELSFNVPARVVDEVFHAQREEGFLPGPVERPEEERDDQPWSSFQVLLGVN